MALDCRNGARTQVKSERSKAKVKVTVKYLSQFCLFRNL